MSCGQVCQAGAANPAGCGMACMLAMRLRCCCTCCCSICMSCWICCARSCDCHQLSQACADTHTLPASTVTSEHRESSKACAPIGQACHTRQWVRHCGHGDMSQLMRAAVMAWPLRWAGSMSIETGVFWRPVRLLVAIAPRPTTTVLFVAKNRRRPVRSASFANAPRSTPNR